VGHERRVTEARGGAEGHVDLVGVEIEERLGEEHLEGEAREALDEARDEGRDDAEAEVDGRGDAEVAARGSVGALDSGACVVEELQNAPDAYAVGEAVLGGLDEARAPAHEGDAEASLQAGDAPADVALALAKAFAAAVIEPRSTTVQKARSSRISGLNVSDPET